jgi:hypothetical protein
VRNVNITNKHITLLPISGAPEQESQTIPTTFFYKNIYLTEQL